MATGSAKAFYLQIIAAVLAGAALGHFYPEIGTALQPLGDAFVRAIRMVVAPIIFVTVVLGIAKLRDSAEVGRISLKAIVYFEVLTTLAMVIGFAVGHFVAPGDGMNIDPATLSRASVGNYVAKASTQDMVGFFVHIIPNTIVGAFAAGDTLSVLLVAVLCGLALVQLGPRSNGLLVLFDDLGAMLFRVLGLIMRLAPIGVFGAVAFAIGRYGIGSLAQLGKLVLCFYLTLLAFIGLVLGPIVRLTGLRLWALARYIREEIFIALGTSTTEPVLPLLLVKLERLGCARSVVGLTLPLGYAFNLDGTSMYFTLAIAFIAQALNIPLSFGDYVQMLAVLLLVSKGAATAPGAGFITLAATLSTVSGKIPVEGIVIILGVDRFMSEARAIGNLFGNTVATVFVAWWEKALDVEQARRVLAREDRAPASPPALDPAQDALGRSV